MPRRRTKPRLTPLQYLLEVLNNPAASPERRDRAAICAAQYVHPKVEPARKKDREAAAAKAAATGWGGDLDADGRSRQ
jgi:hypothetical protein